MGCPMGGYPMDGTEGGPHTHERQGGAQVWPPLLASGQLRGDRSAMHGGDHTLACVWLRASGKQVWCTQVTHTAAVCALALKLVSGRIIRLGLARHLGCAQEIMGSHAWGW